MIVLWALLAKAAIDAVVAWVTWANGDYPGALLFLSFVLVDLASLGVLK